MTYKVMCMWVGLVRRRCYVTLRRLLDRPSPGRHAWLARRCIYVVLFRCYLDGGPMVEVLQVVIMLRHRLV